MKDVVQFVVRVWDSKPDSDPVDHVVGIYGLIEWLSKAREDRSIAIIAYVLGQCLLDWE
jgi:hypothetical protein